MCHQQSPARKCHMTHMTMPLQLPQVDLDDGVYSAGDVHHDANKGKTEHSSSSNNNTFAIFVEVDEKSHQGKVDIVIDNNDIK